LKTSKPKKFKKLLRNQLWNHSTKLLGIGLGLNLEWKVLIVIRLDLLDLKLLAKKIELDRKFNRL
jgi:hypothetical protein